MNNHNFDSSILPIHAERSIPEYTYINLSPRLTSLIFTVPSLNVDLPVNHTLSPQGDLSIKFKNNNRLRLNPFDPQTLEGNNWNNSPTIYSIHWNDRNITGDELIRQKDKLLEEWLLTILMNKEEIELVRDSNTKKGLSKDSFLYRAVAESELRHIFQHGYQSYSHLDPSANFENETMYNSPDSQVKFYAPKTDDGYSGSIIRWKIQDPILYKISGVSAPRVTPLVSHFLPKEIEICKPGQDKFEAIISNAV